MTAGVSARWAAVVVNYEAGPLLVACVESLLADTSAGGPPDVVVVDNGSRDGSVAALRDALPTVRIIDAGTNLGYAGGANRGIAETDTPVVAVCNPDAHVAAGTAGALVGRLDAEPRLGAVGPAVFEPDGSPYPSGREIPSTIDAVGHALFERLWPDNPFTRRYRQLDADPDRPRDVDWVSGAAVWLRRTALDAVDGWDARYFMYCEDVDLCWRLRDAGWRVAYEPAGRVVHIHGASTRRHPYRMIVAHHRSLLRFAARRWRGWRRVLLVPAALFLGLRAAVTALARAVEPRAGRRG
ncbi:MAG TPA: glycosyltransferase family 2 protein [Acidimicrobiia bacterium]|nr:glycosyltransferase family 2 protein [Acidimicrobiia bacterium]